MHDDQMDVRPDHAPVRMVVLDGIVMGHQVCLSCSSDIELTITSNSIVHMMTALTHWLMPEVVCSVIITKKHMVRYAMFVTAITARSIVHVLVKPTRTCGTTIHFATVVKHYLASHVFFGALKPNTNLGFLNATKMLGHMTSNVLPHDHKPTIFNQPEYTVSRQVVHHVGW